MAAEGCRVLAVDCAVVRYRSRRPDDGAARARLRAIASERRRFGYRRVGLLLAREGVRLNHRKLRRLYREERLQVRRRGVEKRRSTKQGNTGTMGVSAPADSIFEWREGGAQVARYGRRTGAVFVVAEAPHRPRAIRATSFFRRLWLGWPGG
jgi:hypothetical protein